MPHTPSLPTFVAWNNANFTSPTGLADAYTGQQIGAGGLNLGDWFNATNQEAAEASYMTNGLLFSGRYRLVQVDAGATAANVAVGKVGYVRQGLSVASVIVTSQGSGQTVGTYTVTSSAAGGTVPAVIQVNVTAAGAINAVLLSGGYGFTSVPTFTLDTGGTPGTVVAQLTNTPNVVTSADVATNAIRPVVFLNSITPGNYGFVQELGTATVLGSTAVGTTTLPCMVVGPATGSNGTVTTVADGDVTNLTLGAALDAPSTNSTFFKVQLQYVPDVQD